VCVCVCGCRVAQIMTAAHRNL